METLQYIDIAGYVVRGGEETAGGDINHFGESADRGGYYGQAGSHSFGYADRETFVFEFGGKEKYIVNAEAAEDFFVGEGAEDLDSVRQGTLLDEAEEVGAGFDGAVADELKAGIREMAGDFDDGMATLFLDEGAGENDAQGIDRVGGGRRIR